MLARLLLVASALAVTGAPAIARKRPAAPKRIQITPERFGTLGFGTAFSAETLQKIFPAATITPESATHQWRIEDVVTGLVATATPTQIMISGGPVEVNGVTIGDDGHRLSAAAFRTAHCVSQPPGTVECDYGAVMVLLDRCSQRKTVLPPDRAMQAVDFEISKSSLAGCRVISIWWTTPVHTD